MILRLILIVIAAVIGVRSLLQSDTLNGVTWLVIGVLHVITLVRDAKTDRQKRT